MSLTQVRCTKPAVPHLSDRLIACREDCPRGPSRARETHPSDSDFSLSIASRIRIYQNEARMGGDGLSRQQGLFREPPRRRRNPLLVVLGHGFSAIFLIGKIVVLGALVFTATAAVSYLVVQREIKGKEMQAPNLAGLTVPEALTKLSKSAPELAMKLDGMEYSNLVNEGEIISQVPLAGSKIKAGSPLRIRVSKGNSKVSCPNVQETNYQEAGIALRRAGLKEGNISLDFDPKVKKDFVIAQDPSPGAELDRQTPVNLLVSKGIPAQVIRMPDLTDKTAQEAGDVLRNAGLQMPGVLETAIPGKDNGLIVEQSPAPGSIVTPETTTTVTVVNNLGVAEPAAPPPDATATPVDDGRLVPIEETPAP